MLKPCYAYVVYNSQWQRLGVLYAPLDTVPYVVGAKAIKRVTDAHGVAVVEKRSPGYAATHEPIYYHLFVGEYRESQR